MTTPKIACVGDEVLYGRLQSGLVVLVEDGEALVMDPDGGETWHGVTTLEVL